MGPPISANFEEPVGNNLQKKNVIQEILLVWDQIENHCTAN